MKTTSSFKQVPVIDGLQKKHVLVVGVNPSQKYASNWISSPGIGVKLKKSFEIIPGRCYSFRGPNIYL